MSVGGDEDNGNLFLYPLLNFERQSRLTYDEQKSNLRRTLLVESLILLVVPVPFWDMYITFKV